MNRFAVAYVLDGLAGDKVNAIRRSCDPQSADVIDAHVTVAGPVNVEASEDDICSAVQQTAAGIAASDVVGIGGCGDFLPVTNTAFLTVSAPEVFIATHDKLIEALGWVEEYPFVPHLTVCEYLSRDETMSVCDQLNELSLDLRVRVDSLTVFSKQSGGKWLAIAKFPLVR